MVPTKLNIWLEHVFWDRFFGKKYYGCTNVLLDKPWCAIQVTNEYEMIHWEECSEPDCKVSRDCENDSGISSNETISTTLSPKDSEESSNEVTSIPSNDKNSGICPTDTSNHCSLPFKY